MKKEIKCPTTYEEQLGLFRKRGCSITNPDYCIERLQSIGYYRISGYFLPFKVSSEEYQKGLPLERIFKIYEFDSFLRQLLFRAIEEVEIYLRSQLSYFFAHKYGALGYRDEANFSQYHNHEKFTRKYNQEIDNNKTVLFVKHHMDVYDGNFPIWVLMELFTFGMLSFFYSDLKMQDKKQIARDAFNTVPKNLSSWLRCCTDLRNICAHYGRLYYRIFSVIPASITVPSGTERKLWSILLCVRSVYPSAEKWNREFVPSLAKIIECYSDDIVLYHLSFPDNWKELILK